MLEEVERHSAETPKQWLADGGYTSLADIPAAGDEGVMVYVPVPETRSEEVDRYQPKQNDAEYVAKWRLRMVKDSAKQIYKERAQASERNNADLSQPRGIRQIPVRGIEKTMMIGLWMAVTYSALPWIRETGAGLWRDVGRSGPSSVGSAPARPDAPSSRP